MPTKKTTTKKTTVKKAPAKKSSVKKTKPAEKSQSELLAFELAELALSKKAENIKVLDLRGLTTMTDFFVVCTASSNIHAKAVMDSVVVGSKSFNEHPWHKEGVTNRSWILLDYIDVVVHIFLNETRQFYGLEKLWGDAKISDVKD